MIKKSPILIPQSRTSTLSLKKLNIPEIAKRLNNRNKTCKTRDYLCLFDWDDTLFPTSTIVQGLYSYTISELNNVFKLLHKLLTSYIRCYGEENIVIITAAENGWIMHSLQLLMKSFPKLLSIDKIYKLLESSSIRQISARSLYSAKYPEQSAKWKYFVMEGLLKKHFNHNTKDKKCNIISIGDSMAEYISSKLAAKTLKDKHNKNILLHRIKLKSDPSIKTMIDQIHILMYLMDEFKVQNTSIDVNYDKP